MKKLLALVLALVMTMSLVTISNAAFSDADKIDHKEAVEVMSALGVINGMPDGSFAPAGNVTRAEMAKMITIIMLGDIDAAAFKGTTTDLTDINGHWAEGYIKYCYSQGVIAGRGDGTFAPNANVTAVEAAKMLLVAIGYNADVQGYVGNDWAINIIRDAQLSKFFDDLSVTSTKVLTRDEAAQMIYNAVNALLIVKEPSLNINTGNITYNYRVNSNNKTLLSETFKMFDVEGLVVKASYNSDTKKYTYTVETGLGNTPVATTPANQITVSTTTDYTALLGQKVKALYKVEKDNTKAAYGIYATATTVSATVGELELGTVGDKKAKLAGTEYSFEANDNTTAVYQFVNGAMAAIDTTNKYLDDITADPASKLTLVDTDKNGKYDYAIVEPVTVAKVTYVGKNGITAAGAYTYEDDTIESGLAKNDFVTVASSINTVYSGNKIAKIATVSGTITGIRNSTEVLLNGTWYKCAQNAGDAVALNKEFTLAVIGGYYYNATKADDTASMETLLLATDKAAVSMGLQNAKFLDSTGKTVVASVSKIGGNDVVTSTNEVTADTLYTYKVKDGKYELTAVGSSNDLGYTYVSNDGTIVAKTTKVAAHTYTSSIYFADDAVVFVKNTTASPESKVTYKVVTGAAVNDWAADYGDTSVVLYKTSNGVKYAVAAFIVEGSGTVPAAKGEVDNYGYVVSEPYSIKLGDDKYDTYELWTGTEKVTVKDEDADLAIVKGDIIKYTNLGNGIIKDSTKVGTAVAVTGYKEGSLFEAVKYDGSAITDTAITKDTVMMYVDSKAVSGVAGGSVELAAVQADGSRIMNAWTVGTAGEAKLIVVEVNNDIEALANGTVSSTGGAAGFTVASINATAVTGTASNTTMTVASMTVEKDLTYAVTGDKVVLTIKCGAETGKAISGAGITLTCDGVSTTVTAKSVASGSVVATLTVPAKSSSNYQVTIANAT